MGTGIGVVDWMGRGVPLLVADVAVVVPRFDGCADVEAAASVLRVSPGIAMYVEGGVDASVNGLFREPICGCACRVERWQVQDGSLGS
jgi:hypothetical protein